MLDNTEGRTFGDVPYFNEAFVKRNKIKSLKGYYSTKATMDYIRKSKDVCYYEFNDEGQLIQDYRTQFRDTFVTMYEYDAKGRLSLLRKSDNGGYHAYRYTYDDKDRIIEKEYRRDLNKSGDKINFELDRSFVVSIEKFEFEDMEGENYKKMYFNTADKVYKEEFFYYNEEGYLAKQESRLKMGSQLNITSYTYDIMGRVTEKKITKRGMSNSTLRWNYEYDEHSNFLAQHYYKDEVYLTEHQIVYDEATFLLDAIITRDEETNFVTILKFADVTFFD